MQLLYQYYILLSENIILVCSCISFYINSNNTYLPPKLLQLFFILVFLLHLHQIIIVMLAMIFSFMVMHMILLLVILNLSIYHVFIINIFKFIILHFLNRKHNLNMLYLWLNQKILMEMIDLIMIMLNNLFFFLLFFITLFMLLKEKNLYKFNYVMLMLDHHINLLVS